VTKGQERLAVLSALCPALFPQPLRENLERVHVEF
jgi:hypothetical protein